MAKEYQEKLSAFLEKIMADQPERVNFECKHFFSGAAFYVEKRICITLTPVGLAIKLPERTINTLLKSKKAVPLKYFPKAPVKKDYVLFPTGIENGGKACHKYMKESIEYVLTLPKPKKKQTG